MDCLTGLVSVKVCGDEELPEGGFINSLPGISLEKIDKAATDDQVTYAKLWEDVQAEAAVRFESDFVLEYSKCYALSAYCDYEDLICNNKSRLLAAWRYLLGNQLMIFQIYTTRINRFSTVGKEDAERLKDFYQVEYERALASAAKLIDPGDCCLDCGGNISNVVWIP